MNTRGDTVFKGFNYGSFSRTLLGFPIVLGYLIVVSLHLHRDYPTRKKMPKPPYLREYHLQDVLAALQFFANYPDYDLTVEEFRQKIGFSPRSGGDWDTLLWEHPEFFRKSERGADYSLILRRARPNPDDHKHPALSPAELSMLIDTVIHLQKHELDMYRDRRWLFPIILSAIGIVTAFAGTLLGVWIKGNG
jgi:hypothetical protein